MALSLRVFGPLGDAVMVKRVAASAGGDVGEFFELVEANGTVWECQPRRHGTEVLRRKGEA